MLQKDMETGEINSKETIELIKRTLIDYQAQAEFRKEKENPTPYQRIVNKLKRQGRNDISKEEILEEYLKEMKEDLLENLKSWKILKKYPWKTFLKKLKIRYQDVLAKENLPMKSKKLQREK
nr:hypothetical protein [Tanacetum cinerariifolium]